MNDRLQLRTKTELAKELGITPRQVDNLIVDGLPRRKNGRGWFFPETAVSWYWKRKAAELAGRAPPDLREAQARKVAAEAKQAELELAKLQGEILTLADMEAIVTPLLERLRARLRNAPGKWSPAFVGLRSVAEAQLRFEEVVQELMMALMDAGDETENGDDEHDDREATGAPTPRRSHP